jgi:hypothetical protein
MLGLNKQAFLEALVFDELIKMADAATQPEAAPETPPEAKAPAPPATQEAAAKDAPAEGAANADNAAGAAKADNAADANKADKAPEANKAPDANKAKTTQPESTSPREMVPVYTPAKRENNVQVPYQDLLGRTYHGGEQATPQVASYTGHVPEVSYLAAPFDVSFNTGQVRMMDNPVL